MNKILLLFLILMLNINLNAQNNSLESYRLYDNKGNEMEFSEMIAIMGDSDVVLFGEIHDNPIGHWLQYKVTKALYQLESKLTLGAEMFESDDQVLIDEYLNGLIRQKDFEKYANLWGNYKSDYKRLFEFAVEHELEFIASNIPRRYASMVSRNGFDILNELSLTAKSYMAPLPMLFDTTIASVVEMMDMEMGHGYGRDNMDIIRAQASKDATMAWFISQNMVKGVPFLHFQGDFHSINYSGIYWYLKQYKSDAKIITLSTRVEEKLDYNPSYSLTADFILVVIDDMTNSY